MISSLSYGHSLATPYRPLPVQENLWAQTARAHEKEAANMLTAACSCPEGPEQDWFLRRAEAEEKASQKCWARVALKQI